MDRIGEDIDRELRRFGAHGVMPAITTAWPSAVGPDIARNAWPARMSRDRVLHVHTSTSAWSFELSNLAAHVLERLAEALGDDVPRGLRFAPGPIPEPAPEPAPGRPGTHVEPTATTAAEAAALAAEIDDDELRDRVARAAALSLECARSDRRFW
jgi:hypothetical protein